MIKPTAAQRALAVQFFKFGIIGAMGFGVDYGFFHLGLDVFGFGRYGGALFSFPFAVTATWFGNRQFTFRGTHKGRASAQWARFFMACAIGLVLNRGTYSLMIAAFPLVYQYPVLGLLGGTAAAMFFNFFAAKRLVFR